MLCELVARWRHRLAARLAPQMREHEHRYLYQRSMQAEARRWLGEFPDIEAVLEWLAAREHDHFRSIDAPPSNSRWRSSVYDFREQLRRRRPGRSGGAGWLTDTSGAQRRSVRNAAQGRSPSSRT